MQSIYYLVRVQSASQSYLLLPGYDLHLGPLYTTILTGGSGLLSVITEAYHDMSKWLHLLQSQDNNLESRWISGAIPKRSRRITQILQMTDQLGILSGVSRSPLLPNCLPLLTLSSLLVLSLHSFDLAEGVMRFACSSHYAIVNSSVPSSRLATYSTPQLCQNTIEYRHKWLLEISYLFHR